MDSVQKTRGMQGTWDAYNDGFVPKELFNINVAWLATLHKLMVAFIDAKFVDDVDAMYECVDSMNLCLYPKMGPENRKVIDDWLNWMEENRSSWCIRNELGQVIKVHPDNKRMLRRTYIRLYRELIDYMEQSGILTKEKKDPRLALGRITG
jgi:hypothetical protein